MKKPTNPRNHSVVTFTRRSQYLHYFHSPLICYHAVFCLASILILGLPFHHQRAFADPIPKDNNRTTNPQSIPINSM